MSQERPPLGRRLAETLGACRTDDVEERVDELVALADAVPDRPAADLRALKTLGDGTRHDIVSLLAAADGELCVCELVPLLPVSESAVSHALSDLTEAGLVTRRKEGTWRYYDATDRARALLSALDATRDTLEQSAEGSA